MGTGVTVADAMSVKPVVVKPELDVAHCTKVMLNKKVGSLLVVKDRKLVGIMTEKDIVSKVVAKGKDPKKLKVQDVMTTRLITVAPDTDILEATKLMKKKDIRRLPVVAKDGELIGMMTVKDMLKIQPHLYGYLREKRKFKMFSRFKMKKQKYIEGECDSCGAYGELHDVEGQMLCEECQDEKADLSEADVEAEE